MKFAFEFAKYEIIIGLIIITVVFLLPVMFVKNAYIKVVLLVLFVSLFAFWMQFFRDPSRNISKAKNNVLAPADGKIQEIEKIFEDNLLHKQMIKIGIFMSPFNCHINRIPIDGIVQNLIYTKGKKLPAYKEEAKYLNENMITHLHGNNIDILVKQIAGIFARRIKNKLKLKMSVTQGEVFGMILIGSKTEIYIPEEKIEKILVNINDAVKAGESILAIIK